jgi:hypothetical protein
LGPLGGLGCRWIHCGTVVVVDSELLARTSGDLHSLFITYS